MTPLRDASPKPPTYPAELEASVVLPKQRASPASSLASLPYRRSNPSLHKLFQSTASISGSRASSGTATPTASVVPGSVFSPGTRQNGTGTPNSLPPGVSDEYRSLIQRAYVPHVAVVADTETEDLVRGKGLEGGLLQLLRPFGEHVPGKVTIRDSVGAGRSWEDFGVRFVGANDGLGIPPAPARNSGLRISTDSQRGGGRVSSSSIRPRRVGGDVAQVEDLVDRHLQYSEFNAHDPMPDYFDQMETPAQADATASPFYALFLKRLLSGIPLVPHETFAHPVASVIAVSSSNADPIEELRRLYARQTQGDLRMPQWVDNQYLRYYVLVHDEETDDITKSNGIFDQMKRHFGLHCHLLRLKRQQCIPSDDDAVRLPTCEWMSASEELAEIQRRETADDITDPAPYLPDSDITGIRTFIRELVAQSIIPHMERQTAQWNEQVLARRRGVAGRFMSISKRWTPFGGSRSSSSSSTSSNSNYDSLQGFYKPDAPEALMRKLADYSFMLRDYKLSLSTYDILRSDFTNDKAWLHAAGAFEMASLSALMTSGPLPTKARTENVDQWIEQAWYNYTNRQGTPTPYYGLRTLATSVELLRLRGSSAADDAARWAARILDTGLVGPVGNALFTERVSACYAVRMGIGSMNWGSRRRKAALWSVLAASTWFQLSKSLQAEKCLDATLRLYAPVPDPKTSQHLQDQDVVRSLPFPQMQTFIDELRQQIINLRLEHRGNYGSEDDGEGTEVAQSMVEEAAGTFDASPRMHRKSLIGAAAPPVDTGPLSPTLERTEQRPDDLFEGA